jgi:hypothetical protein
MVYEDADMYPFYQLGFNNPKPHFSVARRDDGSPPPYNYYNIIALAGGMQNYLKLGENGKMGAALYLIDPDVDYHERDTDLPSEGLRVFNSGSVAKAGGAWRASDSRAGVNIPDPYMGMVVTEPIFFASQSSNYVARGVFTADNRGNIFYVTFVDYATQEPLPREDWEIRTVATLRKSGDDPTDSYALPLGVVAGSRVDRGDKWVAGGTSNVGTRGKAADKDTMIRNEEQLIFSFKLPEMANEGAANYGMTRRSDWTHVSRASADDIDDDDIDYDDINGADSIDPDDDGWYIKLKEGDSHYEDEYVTTAPMMINGKLYVATFQELKYETGESACDTGQKNGVARLYTVALDTGGAAMWGDGKSKFLVFKGMKITGFTHSEQGKKETLLVHYERLNVEESASYIKNRTDNEDALSESDLPNTLEITELGGSGITANVTSNDQVVNYWRFIE